MNLENLSVAKTDEYSISGYEVRVLYQPNSHSIALYRTEGNTEIQMSKPAESGYPIIDGKKLEDFENYTCETEKNIKGTLGVGERMTITSKSQSIGLVRIYIIETSDTIKGVLNTNISYRADNADVIVGEFVDNAFELYKADDCVWSYNGGGEMPANSDTIRKIDLTNKDACGWENVHDYTSACIPVSDIYTANGGIAVGDASITRREVRTPIYKTTNSAQISIKWPGKTIAAGKAQSTGQSFVIVHAGDYYAGLRGYKNAMECIGMVMQKDVANRSYEMRWESWGWGFNWTIELVIGKLDELKEIGVKQITLDDGWYTSAGDWNLRADKFPNGVADMLRLTDAIHARGMSALLWWRPCDGGLNNTLCTEHPEYYVTNKDGAMQRLKSSGITESTYQDTSVMGYALCPCSKGAIDSQLAFVNRAMKDWGFDGFKQDYVWSMPKCYNPAHNHSHIEESTEMQSEFYRTAREAMVANDPDCFNLLCNCGFPQDYYSLQYMTQVITADPTTLDQTRRRAKVYKALMGDCFPICTDHNHVWYPSTIGTGSVLVERRALIGSGATKYARWLNIAQEHELHKGRFVGDLYIYGFDPYETYVVEKDGVMHYAFYRDGIKHTTDGYPQIELRGLNPEKTYRILDYVNNRVVATNLKGNNAVFNSKFATELLIKAVELNGIDSEDNVQPDEKVSIIPPPIYQMEDALSEKIVYSGTWQTKHDDLFLNGVAQYTDVAGSSATLTFNGTTVRWYGQTSMRDYATADIILDGAQLEAAFTYAEPSFGKLLFELTGLEKKEHTISITHASGRMSVEQLTYATETEI